MLDKKTGLPIGAVKVTLKISTQLDDGTWKTNPGPTRRTSENGLYELPVKEADLRSIAEERAIRLSLAFASPEYRKLAFTHTPGIFTFPEIVRLEARQ